MSAPTTLKSQLEARLKILSQKIVEDAKAVSEAVPRSLGGDFMQEARMRAHYARDLRTMLKLIEALEASNKLINQANLDCGDNSCGFKTEKGGMRTNGGCRCESQNPKQLANLARSLVRYAREALAEAEGNLK